ncbi:MAG TPA: hypothetical protein VGH19_16045 [Verrucomicrobiae bacterium]
MKALGRNAQFRMLAWFYNHPEQIFRPPYFGAIAEKKIGITDPRAVWLMDVLWLFSKQLHLLPEIAVRNGHGDWIEGFLAHARMPDYPQPPQI